MSLQPQSPTLPENEPMETANEEDGREGNEEGGEEDDALSSNEEGGISLESTTTKTVLIEKTIEDTEIQRASKDEGPQDQKQGSKGVCLWICMLMRDRYYHHKCKIPPFATVDKHNAVIAASFTFEYIIGFYFSVF